MATAGEEGNQARQNDQCTERERGQERDGLDDQQQHKRASRGADRKRQKSPDIFASHEGPGGASIGAFIGALIGELIDHFFADRGVTTRQVGGFARRVVGHVL